MWGLWNPSLTCQGKEAGGSVRGAGNIPPIKNTNNEGFSSDKN